MTEVKVPLSGVFVEWFKETDLAKGRAGHGPAALALQKAYANGVVKKRGRGVSLLVTIVESEEAPLQEVLGLLYQYCEVCLSENSGAERNAEAIAAKRVMRKIVQIIGFPNEEQV